MGAMGAKAQTRFPAAAAITNIRPAGSGRAVGVEGAVEAIGASSVSMRSRFNRCSVSSRCSFRCSRCGKFSRRVQQYGTSTSSTIQVRAQGAADAIGTASRCSRLSRCSKFSAGYSRSRCIAVGEEDAVGSAGQQVQP